MANVNCYPVNNVIKPDQPVNSQFIQKILDENVGLIHAIIEKQQQNQEAEELLKSLHKNLIYLATIADQTTSAGNSNNPPHSTQQNPYNYPQATVSHSTIQNVPNQNFPQNVSTQPIPSQYVTQPSMVTAPIASIDTAEKKPQSVVEDQYNKESHGKSDSSGSGPYEMEREMDKSSRGRELNQQIAPHKNVDIDKECCSVSQNSDLSKEGTIINTNSSEYTQKFEEPVSTVAPHIGNPNIKTDMPPPSQPIGMHQDKGPMQYPGNQRIMYPAGVPAPSYNQYNPHFEQQNSKFYPQNIYPQQSPYNYQGIYNPYQPVAPPSAAPTHYNQHMMNSPLYPQYPGYYPQPQPGLDQLPQAPKETNLPPQMHPPNPIYPPNTVSQSMYPPHPPSQPNSVPMKSQSSESMPMPATGQNPNMPE